VAFKKYIPVEGITRVLGKLLARLRNRRQSFAHELAVCAIFKDEARYLDEWLRFHHGVGVDHFYLYNNNSSDDFRDVLAPWRERGLVTLIEWPINGQQREAYVNCILHFRNHCRWIAFIDLDEFLFSPEDLDLRQVLARYKDVSAIFVYWVLFGANGHHKRPAGSTIEAYTRSLDKESAINDRFVHDRRQRGKRSQDFVTGWAQDGKSIVNPRLVRWYTIHKPRALWLGELVDENRLPPQQREPGAPISYSILRINHYWSRSIQDLTEKVEKGIVNFKKQPEVLLETWLARERELNTQDDRVILPTWQAVKLAEAAYRKTESEGASGHA
jgi:hypothetical protein